VEDSETDISHIVVLRRDSIPLSRLHHPVALRLCARFPLLQHLHPLRDRLLREEDNNYLPLHTALSDQIYAFAPAKEPSAYRIRTRGGGSRCLLVCC